MRPPTRLRAPLISKLTWQNLLISSPGCMSHTRLSIIQARPVCSPNHIFVSTSRHLTKFGKEDISPYRATKFTTALEEQTSQWLVSLAITDNSGSQSATLNKIECPYSLMSTKFSIIRPWHTTDSKNRSMLTALMTPSDNKRQGHLDYSQHLFKKISLHHIAIQFLRKRFSCRNSIKLVKINSVTNVFRALATLSVTLATRCLFG